MSVNLNGKVLFTFANNIETLTNLRDEIENQLGLSSADYYLISNGKIVNESSSLQNCLIHLVPRFLGGKGGFGSMLRAIGAQIEKTTNREACRDLSGRRLRDINEEKRLKTWIAQQVEREQEADDRRQKKLERLCQTPKHVFKDVNYEKERSELPEKAEDALTQGLKASCSGKRKLENKSKKNKKVRLWGGSEDELSSSIDSESEDEEKSSNKSLVISSTKLMDETSTSKLVQEEILQKEEKVEASTSTMNLVENVSNKEENVASTSTNKLDVEGRKVENIDDPACTTKLVKTDEVLEVTEENQGITQNSEIIEENTQVALQL